MEGSRRRSLAFSLLGRQRGHLQAWEGREALESLDGLFFLEPAVCPAVPVAGVWWLDLEEGCGEVDGL